MEITFAGTSLAKSFDLSGTDAITGFQPEDDHQVQVVPFPRAQWVTLIPRGNQMETLTGLIIPAPSDSLEDVLVDMHLRSQTLPRSGGLLLSRGSTFILYTNAARKSCRIMQQKGVSYALQLTFLAINPLNITDKIIRNPDGSMVLNPNGAPLYNL